MFGTLGGPELLLIFVIALIVFGPRKLPEIGKSVGKMMAEFRKASNDFKQTIESEVEAEKLREAVRVDPYSPSSSSHSPAALVGAGDATSPSLIAEPTGEAGGTAASSLADGSTESQSQELVPPDDASGARSAEPATEGVPDPSTAPAPEASPTSAETPTVPRSGPSA